MLLQFLQTLMGVPRVAKLCLMGEPVLIGTYTQDAYDLRPAPGLNPETVAALMDCVKRAEKEMAVFPGETLTQTPEVFMSVLEILCLDLDLDLIES